MSLDIITVLFCCHYWPLSLKATIFPRPTFTWLGSQVQFTSPTSIPRLHQLPAPSVYSINQPEPSVNYTFRILFLRKSLKRAQKRQLGILLPTFHPIPSLFQNKTIMEQKIKLRNCKMATEMRYLAHLNFWIMMGYCISALYTEAAMYIKPHYYLGAKKKKNFFKQTFLQLT